MLAVDLHQRDADEEGNKDKLQHVSVARRRAEKIVRHHVHQRLQRAARLRRLDGFALSLGIGVGLELLFEVGFGLGGKAVAGVDGVDHQQADSHGDGGGGDV